MKPNSISGVTYYVDELTSTAEFYETLGFRRGIKGAGQLLYVTVDDIEDFHKEVVAAGMKPDGEPEVQASGNREFVLRDPDGYKLAFLQKK